jgi:hypothetical protein
VIIPAEQLAHDVLHPCRQRRKPGAEIVAKCFPVPRIGQDREESGRMRSRSIGDVSFSQWSAFGQGATGDLTEICIQISDKADWSLEARLVKKLRKPSGLEPEQLMPR